MCLGEVKVPNNEDDMVTLVESVELQGKRESFQPNPFWGPHAPPPPR